jgi:hypothetical protein
MMLPDNASCDDRVTAILADPRGYFAAARERARVVAIAEVEVTLAALAQERAHRDVSVLGGPSDSSRLSASHRR